MPNSVKKHDKIVTNWIIEYARSWMWQEFKACSSIPTSSDEFIRGVIMRSQSIGCCSVDSLLTEWLFLIYYGYNLCGDGLDTITPLEKAISMLPRLKENFSSLRKKELIQVESLLMEQAVLACIEGRQYSLAKMVKDRIWNANRTQAEEEISSRLDLMIQSRSLSGFDAKSAFKDLIQSIRKLLEDLFENQLPCPYLVTKAAEEGNKKVCDEDQMARNLAAATQTGLIMRGELFNSYISKHNLSPVFGVGFVSPDKFQRAVEGVRSRKDQILMSAPDVLPQAVALEAARNSSPEPVVIEKAVSSSSLKGKPRERRSSNCRVNKRSSKESHQKDTSEDSSNDHDNSTEKIISLRERMARSRNEPLFGDVEQRWRPSDKQVKRKPRSKWTVDEEKTVYKAIQKYGVSNWSDIVKANILPGRSNVDIKDKWRTMVKTGRDKELKDEISSQLDSSSEEN